MSTETKKFNQPIYKTELMSLCGYKCRMAWWKRIKEIENDPEMELKPSKRHKYDPREANLIYSDIVGV